MEPLSAVSQLEYGEVIMDLLMTTGLMEDLISGASASATLADAGTTVVRLVADTACFVRVAAAATATTAAYLPAGVVEYFSVDPGQAVHVIGTSGFLYVTETS